MGLPYSPFYNGENKFCGNIEIKVKTRVGTWIGLINTAEFKGNGLMI